MQKILLPILILLSLSVIVILPNSLNICITDGCNFNNNVCDNSACINETITQHLGERMQLFNTTVKLKPSISFIILALVVIISFVVKKYLKDGKSIIAESYVKQKFFNSSATKLFNYLIKAFSDGIIHFKLY